MVRVAGVLALIWGLQVQAEPAGVAVTEFPTENAALIAATQEFFEAVETAETPQKRNRTIGIPLQATKSRATTGDTDVLTRMGPVRHLTGYRISWYPLDQLLGTVDFMGTWDGNRNLVCGYVTWDLSRPEAPELHSITASFVDLGELDDASAVQIHRTLMRANCAFGAIDANYAFFDPLAG